MKRSRLAGRIACLAFVVHGCLAIGVLALERTPRGANIFGWDGYRLFQAVEYPVLWAIDALLERFFILPARWFSPDFERATSLNCALACVLMGGAFYSGVAAGLTQWLSATGPAMAAGKRIAAEHRDRILAPKEKP